MNPTIRRPSAWLPMAMSVTTLAILLVHFIRFGFVREADEGTSAHLFQILMGGQLPIIAFFIIKWVPRTPKQALLILALQVALALAALAPVFFFHL